MLYKTIQKELLLNYVAASFNVNRLTGIVFLAFAICMATRKYQLLLLIA